MSLHKKLSCDTLSCKMGFTVKGIIRILEKKFSLRNIDLTIEQFFLLNILNSREGLILQDLSNILDRDKSAIARHVNGLEDKLFVARETDPGDKRKKRLLITKPGVQVLEEAKEMVRQANEEITCHISKEDLQKFEAVLTSIYERIDSEKLC